MLRMLSSDVDLIDPSIDFHPVIKESIMVDAEFRDLPPVPMARFLDSH
jgi:hypothetical protein